MKELTIVTVFYNRKDMVHTSVSSILEQLDDSMELLLIDDGSTDGTTEIIQEYNNVKNIRVITQENKGFVNTMIWAIQNSSSKFIAVHGSGDLSINNRFKKQVSYLKDHPDIGVVGCHSIVVDKNNEKINKIFKSKINDLTYKEDLLLYNPFIHGEVMFRRDIYDASGGYRPVFKYSQDLDLWCRMSHHTKFYIMEDVLYKRYFAVKGSVSGVPRKSIEQQLLAEFSRYCHLNRINKNIDPYEVDPNFALLSFERNDKINYEFFRFAILSLCRSDMVAFDEYKEALSSSLKGIYYRFVLSIASLFPGKLINYFIKKVKNA
ncbi:TPA: glycosyltransferase [Vibrio diabolicus]